ncbi:hypothetical protein [Frigoribacterium sp. SL97]|uniref:hypothetical protein n=1 Tax=Frigoribacterium sp. SL97 TaxID=2994664 RepID=UPI00226FD843|nr:hypothetical protein [Frigoribacterium sp. SL97]WAC50567.1 hypothetical protein OVA02_11855 [Frigoribacterium sp. SL97]
MTPKRLTGHSIRAAVRARFDVLRDKRGNSITEAIVGVTISLIVLSIIAGGSVAAVTALTTQSTNAERLQQLTIMTAQPEIYPAWEAATGTPQTKDIVLPSGSRVPTYFWRVGGATGSDYYASTARSGKDVDIAKCRDKATVRTDICLYSARYHANDMRSLQPITVPGLAVTDLTTTLPLGTTVATLPAPATETAYRFFISAAALGDRGELHFKQGGKSLAIIPIGTTTDSYFGTIAVKPGTPVTVINTDRVVKVDRVLVYKAGA